LRLPVLRGMCAACNPRSQKRDPLISLRAGFGAPRLTAPQKWGAIFSLGQPVLFPKCVYAPENQVRHPVFIIELTRMAHPNSSRFHKISARWGIVFVLILLLLLCSAYFLRPSLRARYLFSQLGTLQLGHSTFEDAQRLARKIGATPTGPCNQSGCEWDVRMDNSELPRWWRGSGESFVVTFDVKDSVVVRKTTGYGVGLATGFSPSSVGLEEQEHWGRMRRPEPVAAGWKTTDLYRYYEFVVYMTPEVSAEDRRRYTSFNFHCFWKYKGCKDARELLPTADPPNF
jgi:hypothetical protein